MYRKIVCVKVSFGESLLLSAMTQLSAKRYSEGGAQDMKQGRFNSTLDDTPTTFDDNKIVP